MKKKTNKHNGKNKWQQPKLYNEAEMDAVESHIAEHFGKFESVFHEIVSTDIHVDIALIPPAAERDYNVLVTMGSPYECTQRAFGISVRAG